MQTAKRNVEMRYLPVQYMVMCAVDSICLMWAVDRFRPLCAVRVGVAYSRGFVGVAYSRTTCAAYKATEGYMNQYSLN